MELPEETPKRGRKKIARASIEYPRHVVGAVRAVSYAWHAWPLMLSLMHRMPVFFGSAHTQAALIRIFKDGYIRGVAVKGITRSLRRSGLITEVRKDGHSHWVLDPRHPAYHKVRKLLATVTGVEPGPVRLSPQLCTEYAFDPVRPLAHGNACAFRILHALATRGELSLKTARLYVAGVSSAAARRALRQLLVDGVVTSEGDRFKLASNVPNQFPLLIQHLGGVIAKRDASLSANTALPVPRVGTFCAAEDGAPPLFGPDLRLRNLMVLAKQGRMYLADLRKFTGVESIRRESSSDAPFGRGGVVRVWDTADGPAAEIDPTHPLRLPLRKLLLRLEQQFPIPAHRVRTPPPCTIKKSWNGDWRATFGGDIPTSVLFSIGVLGFTFEALCVAVCTGHNRVNVKSCVRKLEECGLLAGDRVRRPGFNVRVLRLSKQFCAERELQLLLELACDMWPSFAKRVHSVMQSLPPGTKAHLIKRHLFDFAPYSGTVSWRRMSEPERKRDCRRSYCLYAASHGRDIPSYELQKENPQLYARIRRAWKSFIAFRKDVGLPDVVKGTKCRPSESLRDWCVDRYLRRCEEYGFQPNSEHLLKRDFHLLRCIYVQWGGFPEFCDYLKAAPKGRKRSSKITSVAIRQSCILEYAELAYAIGRTPREFDMRLHTNGLYKRIFKEWGGLKQFRKETQP